MATTIVTKNGSGAPTASDLVAGELAVDLTNGRLYTEDSGGTVIEIGLNPSGNVDVTGTVTADGLTVDGNITLGAGDKLQYNSDRYFTPENNVDGAEVSANGVFRIKTGTTPAARLLVAGNGDISFYEDTGTTAKLFWDASAESLGIGTSSPSKNLHVYNATTNRPALIESGDADSLIEFKDNSTTNAPAVGATGDSLIVQTGSSAAERMRIDASGNVGIGVVPASGWSTSPYNVLDINTSSVAANSTTLAASLNAYNDGSAWRYKGTGVASQYYQASGNHVWQTAASGTAGNTISFSEAMRIANTGQLLVGSGTSPASGEVKQTLARAGSSYLEFQNTSTNTGSTIGTSGENLIIYTNSGALGAETYTERMRIDSSGNVKINDGYLEVNTETAAAAVVRIDYNSTDSIRRIHALETGGGNARPLQIQAQDVRFRDDTTERVRIDSNGQVDVGSNATASAGLSKQLLSLVNPSGTTGTAARLWMSGTNATSRGTYIEAEVQSTGNDHDLIFATSASGAAPSEAMRIDSSGDFYVGTTTTGSNIANGFTIQNSAGATYTALGHPNGTASGSAYAVFSYNSGTIGSITQNGTTAVLYNVSSDQRLKKNIVDAPSASDDIDAIQVRSFDWKADGSHQKYGMVAQELQTVAPEAVSGDADSEEMMGVDYSKLVPMLVKEIQSLRARVAQLES